jgi:hypothetical protein
LLILLSLKPGEAGERETSRFLVGWGTVSHFEHNCGLSGDRDGIEAHNDQNPAISDIQAVLIVAFDILVIARSCIVQEG